MTEMEAAADQLSTEIVSDVCELFHTVNNINNNAEFVFDNEGKQLLRQTMDEFVLEVNQAIQRGRCHQNQKSQN